MATKGNPEELTTPKRRAIAALLSTRNVLEAARAAHVGERTLHRWLCEPVFRAAVLEAEGAAIDQAARRLIGMQDGAIDTLSELLDDVGTPAAVKLRTAQAILDYLLRLRELRNVEQRLTDLEAAIYGGDTRKAY